MSPNDLSQWHVAVYRHHKAYYCIRRHVATSPLGTCGVGPGFDSYEFLQEEPKAKKQQPTVRLFSTRAAAEDKVKSMTVMADTTSPKRTCGAPYFSWPLL